MSVTITHVPKLINGRTAEFYGEPKSPFKHVGEAWITGWDIPTRYAIDADDQCWADNAHGHPLSKVTPRQFVGIFEQEQMKRKFQEVLGLEVDEPSWMKEARAHGWLSPEEGEHLMLKGAIRFTEEVESKERTHPSHKVIMSIYRKELELGIWPKG